MNFKKPAAAAAAMNFKKPAAAAAAPRWFFKKSCRCRTATRDRGRAAMDISEEDSHKTEEGGKKNK